MLLASVETVRNALGFDSGTDINNAIKEGLNAAEPYIAARLNIPGFARVTRTDKFFVQEPLLMQNGFGYTQFRLRHGFLTGAPAVAEWAHSPDFAGGKSILDNLEVDTEKGIVADLLSVYNKMFVRITYTAGFETKKVNGEPTEEWADVPEWLQQAARLQCLISLVNHPIIKETKMDLDQKGMKRQFEMTMANHLRYAPTAVMPL